MPFAEMDDRLFSRLVRVRRELHRHPEPGFGEYKTQAAIAGYLEKLHIPYRKVAETGIVARLESGGRGAPAVALRADIDALPVEEKTGLPFSSRVRGMMHACGHDGHVAIVLGAAELLKKDPPDGNVVFLFQPAEEGAGGALSMIKDGCLQGVDMIFGGHIDSSVHLGQVGIREGMDTAYTDSIEFRIVGRGAHAARPHEAVDSVVVASHLVMALQNIVSRNVDPHMPAVVTIGSMHAGTVHNVIAPEATLLGTVRNTDGPTRRRILDRIKRTARSIAALHGAKVELKITEGYPPVVNHPKAYEISHEVAAGLFGKQNVVKLPRPSMGGEDFAFYLHKVPGCFVRLGAVARGKEAPLFHSPTFDFDERAIRLGAVYYKALVREAVRRIRSARNAGAPGPRAV
jgi:hippurate hydrolase